MVAGIIGRTKKSVGRGVEVGVVFGCMCHVVSKGSCCSCRVSAQAWGNSRYTLSGFWASFLREKRVSKPNRNRPESQPKTPINLCMISNIVLMFYIIY